jgi:Family of unknown function (DUF5681)
MSRSSRGTKDASGPSDEPAALDSRAVDSEYRVGPGRPPKEHQFKPGQSGNPKGAERKPPSIMRDVKALLEKALRDTVRIRKGDKERNVSRLAIGFEQLANQFAKGDRHARRDVFELAERFGIDLLAGQGGAPEADRLAISESDAALLADYFNRRQGQNDPCGGELNSSARDPHPEGYEAPSRARRGEEAS